MKKKFLYLFVPCLILLQQSDAIGSTSDFSCDELSDSSEKIDSIVASVDSESDKALVDDAALIFDFGDDDDDPFEILQTIQYAVDPEPFSLSLLLEESWRIYKEQAIGCDEKPLNLREFVQVMLAISRDNIPMIKRFAKLGFKGKYDFLVKKMGCGDEPLSRFKKARIASLAALLFVWDASMVIAMGMKDGALDWGHSVKKRTFGKDEEKLSGREKLCLPVFLAKDILGGVKDKVVNASIFLGKTLLSRLYSLSVSLGLAREMRPYCAKCKTRHFQKDRPLNTCLSSSDNTQR